MNRKAIILMLNQMTLSEIAEEIMALNLEILSLQAKERKALKESGERALLAFQMAETSDRMKLELILAGALISPPTISVESGTPSGVL